MTSKLSLSDIQSEIMSVDYIDRPFNTTLTICMITLNNGYTVVGHSACINPDDYDMHIGRQVAYKKAEDQIWGLLGYVKRTEMAKAHDELIGVA